MTASEAVLSWRDSPNVAVLVKDVDVTVDLWFETERDIHGLVMKNRY